MRRAKLTAAVGAILAAAVFSWPATAAVSNVSIDNLQFNPANVTIKEGDSVKWTNDESVASGRNHTVKSDEVSGLSSPTLPPGGGTYTFTFGPNTAGTYDYYCSIHGSATMSGTITVQQGTTTVAPTTTRLTTTTRPVPTTRATTTTRRVTTTSIDDTTTTETLDLETSTTEETTSTTSGDVAIRESGDGGVNGLAVAGLVAAILGVLGGGGYIIYRLRAGGL